MENSQIEDALHRAARLGDVGEAAALLNRGIDINTRDGHGHTPLHYTVAGGHNRPDRLGVAELLLDWGADPNAKNNAGDTPLSLAAKKKPYTAMILLLLSRGADPNTRRDSQYGGYPPLHPAAYHGDLTAVEYLLLHGADVNARNKSGSTPLHDAARKNHDEVARLLLSAGANPNAQDNTGNTPLQIAQAQGSADVAKVLENLR